MRPQSSLDQDISLPRWRPGFKSRRPHLSEPLVPILPWLFWKSKRSIWFIALERAYSQNFEMFMPYSLAFLRISGFMRMVVIFFFCFTVYHLISEICFSFCWMEYAIPAREHAMPIIAKGKAQLRQGCFVMVPNGGVEQVSVYSQAMKAPINSIIPKVIKALAKGER